MELRQIASFAVDHTKLDPGMYTSRVDGDVVTYDVRMKKPNAGDYFTTGAGHSMEHLFATYVRSGAWSDHVVYVGPMGCRTGFYLVVFGEVSSEEILPLVREMFEFVRDFEGEIPGARPEECGNYLDQNLGMAKWLAARYLERDLDGIDEAHLNYPTGE